LDYQIKFDLKHRIILLSFQNDLTESVYLAGFAAAVSFTRGHDVEGAIMDFSDILEFSLSSRFVRRLADVPAMLSKPRVTIAPQKVVFGMVRMFQMLREASSSSYPAVVTTMEDALKYLGVESPEFQLLEQTSEASI
jgi:hypothetical protein